MPDLNSTLDTVLAFVTVVLVLSLIIQSLQNILKRLLRMKSRQAEQSLRYLFDYVLTQHPSKYTGWKYASPILRLVLPRGEKGIADSVVNAVKDEVLELGRKSFWGKTVLDSVTREDLTKILNKLPTDPNVEEEVKKAIEGKVKEIETWYDTVMPGLAERHERSMKWVAVMLSFLVVIVFNANAFTVYKYVASDSDVQKKLIDYGEKLKDDRKQTADQKQPDPSAQPETDAAKAERIKKETKDDIDKIKALRSELGNFGLKPLRKLGDLWNISHWRENLLGWLAMTLLLSMGAPFWEDALGSLFGLKNTLRGKGKEEQKKQP